MMGGKAVVTAFCVIGIVTAADSRSALAQETDDFLGVQTHFSQNWSMSALSLAGQIQAGMMRDSVPWSTVEVSPGEFRFSDPRIRPLETFCKKGGRLLLTAVPGHGSYDGGMTAHSPTAMMAFADYINALAKHFGPCLLAVEIGNEINGKDNLKYPTGIDRDAAYVALMRTLKEKVKPEYPALKLLGGSTNVIGTGFLKGLFAKGMLKYVDGIVVHPYRKHAENIDVELNHLIDAMKAAGQMREIWATEFSDEYERPETAAPELVKFVTLMGAEPQVRAAFWYALNDQKWFRNMGLFATDGRIKPAGEAFALMQSRLLERGRPVRIDVGDPNVRLYRFGADTWVVWGASGQMRFTGNAELLDSRGRALPGDAMEISDQPVIAIGASGYKFAPGTILADSLFGYLSGPFSYWARTADGKLRQLDWLDGPWTSFQGYRFFKPLWLGDNTGAPSGDGKNPVKPIVRFTAAAAGSFTMSLCVSKGAKGDGIEVRLLRGSTELERAIVNDGSKNFIVDVPAMRAGETIDFEVGPNYVPGGDSFSYRMRVANGVGNPAVLCG